MNAAPPMTAGLSRYCLSKNPFQPEKPKSPIQLSAKPPDVPLLLRHPNLKLFDKLDKFLDSAVKKVNSATYVLITGPDSTGKSSIAHYVVDAYCRKFNASVDLAIPLELPATNSFPVEMLKKWLQTLLFLSRPYLAATDELREIRNATSSICQTNVGALNGDILHDATVALVEKLRNPVGRVVAAYYDNNSQSASHAPGILSLALYVFSFAPMLFVAAVPTDSDFADVGKKFGSFDQGAEFLRIDLAPVKLADAKLLIEERWQPGHDPCPLSAPECAAENSVCKKQSPNHPNPFGNLNWTQITPDKVIPIENLLQGLAGILKNKTPDEQQGTCWPHDKQLEVTRAELEQAYVFYKMYLESP